MKLLAHQATDRTTTQEMDMNVHLGSYNVHNCVCIKNILSLSCHRLFVGFREIPSHFFFNLISLLLIIPRYEQRRGAIIVIIIIIINILSGSLYPFTIQKRIDEQSKTSKKVHFSNAVIFQQKPFLHMPFSRQIFSDCRLILSSYVVM